MFREVGEKLFDDGDGDGDGNGDGNGDGVSSALMDEVRRGKDPIRRLMLTSSRDVLWAVGETGDD